MRLARTAWTTALMAMAGGLALLSPLLPRSGRAAETILRADFEEERVGNPPAGWRPFPARSRPTVRVAHGGAESRRSVRGTRSESGGLTALSRAFSQPHTRVMIEFSFAFSPGRGRSLNVWTHEPHGKDASQLNLCIQNGALMQFEGRTRVWTVITRDIVPTRDSVKPVWHRLRAVLDANRAGIDYWISKPHSRALPEKPITRAAYRTGLPIAAIDLVSGQRIAPRAWYLLDDLVVTSGSDLPPPHDVAPLPAPYKLWTGPPIPSDVRRIPFVKGVTHQTIHRPEADGYRFLHGAAIVQHQGVFYANWANSPTNENGPHETLQGRRSFDGGETWSNLEVIGAGFPGRERHSHGVLFVHQDQVWTICSRFGLGDDGRRFSGLKAEAFVLNSRSDKWESRGVVMRNCWPYDAPVRMGNGSFITGGQDKDGLPVVAISRGENLTRWDSVLIPFDPRLRPSFAETTVWADERRVMAVIRGGGGVAWVATSNDFGRRWSTASASNLPMPRAKAYLGRLSTGQLYLLSNLKNRDTLVIHVGRPGESTLSCVWRIRHGKSGPPRFPGNAKAKQWSYPYGYEQDGVLYVVYSIGKEDCGLSRLPIKALEW